MSSMSSYFGVVIEKDNASIEVINIQDINLTMK